MKTTALLNSKFKLFGKLLAGFLAVLCVVFFLLKVTSPPSGSIDVAYDGVSASGVYWKLENRSNRTVYLQGTENHIWPIAPVTKCRTLDYSSGDSDPPYFADGSPSVIKISPGNQFRLHVETSLPNKYKGGHCYLKLSLLGGTFVESKEFTPQ